MRVVLVDVNGDVLALCSKDYADRLVRQGWAEPTDRVDVYQSTPGTDLNAAPGLSAQQRRRRYVRARKGQPR